MDRDMTEPVQILLVEDDPGDVLLTCETLRETKVNNELHVVSDGEEAMRFLRREDGFADAPRPHVVLLDLNLPRKSGREVLAEIKQDPRLKIIPVVVLTTSRAEEDILRSYQDHANAYIAKPIDLDEFLDVVQALENFWLTFVQLPRVP